MDKVLTRSNLIHAVSGASGSALSLTLFYPLDSLRTRLQVGDNSNPLSVLQSVVKTDGISALYNGWFAVISSITVSNFVYFYTYTALKSLHSHTALSPLRDLISSMAAGCVNVIATTPLWVANTRLKLQNTKAEERKYSNLITCILHIAKKEGPLGLWNGVGTSLLLVAAPTLHFVMYEAFKRWGSHALQTEELPGSFIFLVSGLAKFLSTLITYPLQVIQSRMRAGMNEDSQRMKSAFWVLHVLIKQNGVYGLYKGFETKIAQTILTTAFMFLFYEKLVTLIRILLK